MSKSLVTRRQALEALGIGIAAAATPAPGVAQDPTFPKGAIIRAILKDYAPEDLAGGATLFHEHMSLAPDFMPRWMASARATREASGQAPAPGRQGGAAPPAPAQPEGVFFMQDVDLMADEMKQAKAEGIACIVDGGHADMGRDINFLRQISMKSGLPIVAGAGFYTQPFYPKDISTWSETQIFDA